MKVNEIFTSIDGEGIRQGFLCSFVRLYGCNLHCSYCDTRYACENNSYTDLSIGQILDRLNGFNVYNVTITGGEPLLAEGIKELVQTLADNGYFVNIETNGSVDYSRIWTREERKSLSDRLFLTVDYKLPDSGMEKMMAPGNFKELQSGDVLKFVVQSRKDLLAMRDFLNSNQHISASIYVSPVFGRIAPREIVEFMQEFNLTGVRVQLQIHKFIWAPDTKGV